MKKNLKVSADSIDELRVDVMNDTEMVGLGIRVAPRVPRDPNVWTKSSSEKFILKREKARQKNEFLTRWTGKRKSIPVYGKLVVNLKKVSNSSRLTLSFECGQSDIQRILSQFRINDSETNVKKYSWNGKTYAYTELPFWGRRIN